VLQRRLENDSIFLAAVKASPPEPEDQENPISGHSSMAADRPNDFRIARELWESSAQSISNAS